MPAPKDNWLKNAEAAELLAVSVRTIKSWMTCKERGEALGAVQHGKQWRIPRPQDLSAWGIQTRARLKKLDICPPESWERELEKFAKESCRYELEALRLWLAGTMMAVERGGVSQEAREGLLLLLQTACEILAPLPRHEMEVDKLKAEFPARLKARGLSEEEVTAVMAYWPDEKCFERARAAHRLEDIEAIRQSVDYTQAVRELEQSEENPTAKNIRPLVHKDIVSHINDTWEQLPGIVVRNPTLGNVCDQIAGKKSADVTVDFRQRRDSLPLRTFRRRHPRRKNPQRNIVNVVYGIRDSLPGSDEKSSGR